MSEFPRQPEPEYMDDTAEAVAYAEADFAEVNAAFVERLLELAGQRTTASAVDLGTGPGDIPIRLAKARPAWSIAAVDASEAMLAIARRGADEAGVNGQIKFLLADAKTLPLPDGCGDVVLSNSILHHVNDTASLWSQVRRIARPGAVVLFRDLCRPSSREAAAEIVREHAGGESELLQEEFYRSLLSAYTPEEARAQLAAAGLGSLVVQRVTDRHMDIFGVVEDPPQPQQDGTTG
ncbi:MAG: class I SAM-dependent methyltransferase [Phycisphaerae bacterium]